MKTNQNSAHPVVSFSSGYLRQLLAGLAGSLILASAPAGAATAEEAHYAAARVGIQKTLDATVAAMKRGANVDEVADILFTDDVVIAVPGTKAAPGVTIHGLKAFKPTLAEWIKEDIVSWTIEEPMKVSGGLAVAYIIGKVGPNDKSEPNTSYRALWVFEKGPKGWKSSREAQVGSHSPDLPVK